jgi:hypothetical protein
MANISKPWPTSRQHWASYHAKRFCKTGSDDAAHMAAWYQLMDLSEENAHGHF